MLLLIAESELIWDDNQSESLTLILNIKKHTWEGVNSSGNLRTEKNRMESQRKVVAHFGIYCKWMLLNFSEIVSWCTNSASSFRQDILEDNSLLIRWEPLVIRMYCLVNIKAHLLAPRIHLSWGHVTREENATVQFMKWRHHHITLLVST